MKRMPRHLQVEICRAILAHIAKRAKVDPKDLAGRDMARRFIAPRSEVCRLANAAGVGQTVIAYVLNRDLSTILYHINPAYRARKTARRLAYDKNRVRKRPCTTTPRSEESASPV